MTSEFVEVRELRCRNRLLEKGNEVLRRAAAYLWQVTCRVLKLARERYYRWRADPVSDAERVEAYRANALFDAHRDDPEFGCRSAPWVVSARPVSVVRRARPVRRCMTIWSPFTADAPNLLWLSDITVRSAREGKLYLCAIKDAFSNRIVGYLIDARMKSGLAVTALGSAVARRGAVAGCILHSDRGSQFRSRKFVHALGYHDMVGSMGGVGAAGDNAAMESFFSLRVRSCVHSASGIDHRRRYTQAGTR